MIELGHFALILAMATALIQFVGPAIGARHGWSDLMRIGETAAIAQFLLVGASFLALVYAFATSDMSVTLVYSHSSVSKPLVYKIAGVWGNHKGSMLLWSVMLGLFGALVAVFGRRLPLSLRARVLAVQGAISVAFLAFIIFTSNPFLRWPDGLGAAYMRDLLLAYRALPGFETIAPRLPLMDEAALLETIRGFGDLIPAPSDGAGLTAVLQDPALAGHPPLLYTGYVGLSVAYAFAIAALWEGRVDGAWARWVRPWTLFAWLTLTVGIGLGAYWAYYEIGWGGWWFWDPVENASFMPWLAATALLHSAIVVEKRGELKSWTVLLAVVAFSFSLLGAFLVRSGVLNSVHAFASDPSRGVFLLALFVGFVGGALALYAIRAASLASEGLFKIVSRESALLVNNALLAASLAAVMIGTLAPVVAEAVGDRLSVGPPFFDSLIALFWAPLLLLLPLGAAAPWKRGDAGALSRRFLPAAAAALAFALAIALLRPIAAHETDLLSTLLGALGAFIAALIGAWAFLGAAYEPFERARIAETIRGRSGWAVFWRRLRATPVSMVGKTVAHAGLGLFALGAALSPAFESEEIGIVAPGDRLAHGDVVFVAETFEAVTGPNYEGVRAAVAIYDGETRVATVFPELRRFEQRGERTSEVGLSRGVIRDFYVLLDQAEPPQQGWVLLTKVRPFVSWIWFGCLAMTLGGALSLFDRRLRVGAPAARKVAAAAGAALVLVLTAPQPAGALIRPSEQLADPAEEARARDLFEELRCVTCPNQSIADSDAPVAGYIRADVRRGIVAGASDDEIVAQLVAAYGEDVRLSPNFWGSGFFVWALPILALIGAATLAALKIRGRAEAASAATSGADPQSAPLSAEEQARLDALMQRRD